MLSSSPWIGNNDIDPLGSIRFKYKLDSNEDVVNIQMKLNESCNSYIKYDDLNTNVTVSRGEVRIIIILLLLCIMFLLFFYLELFN